MPYLHKDSCKIRIFHQMFVQHPALADIYRQNIHLQMYLLMLWFSLRICPSYAIYAFPGLLCPGIFYFRVYGPADAIDVTEIDRNILNEFIL